MKWGTAAMAATTLATLICSGGCKEDGALVQVGPAPLDGAPADMARPLLDTSPLPDTRTLDLPPPPLDMGPDMCAWPPDLGIDQVPRHNMLYISGYSDLSAWRITTYGTCKAKVASLPAKFKLVPMTLAGQKTLGLYLPGLFPYWPAAYDNLINIQLPNQQGWLFQFKSWSPGLTGFFVVRPTGQAQVLASMKIKTSVLYEPQVALNATGTLLAAGRSLKSGYGKGGVDLIRLDNKTFANGSSRCEVTPVSPKLTSLRTGSFTFTGKYFYFSGKDANKQALLYRAPLNCSARATLMPLPKVGGKAPVYVAPRMGTSKDGKKVILLAGSSAKAVDVLVQDDAASSTANITASPARYRQPGSELPLYTDSSASTGKGNGALLSPTGKHAAYIHLASGVSELYVRPTDLKKTATLITGPANFKKQVNRVTGLFWSSDDDLLFWAGNMYDRYVLFHYRHSTGAVTKLTGTGSATKPFSASGSDECFGGWYAPNGKFFYFLQQGGTHRGNNGPPSLRALELATAKIKTLHTGQLGYRFSAARSGGKLYFISAVTMHLYDDEVWVFDQNTASTPVKVTGFKGSLPYPSLSGVGILGIQSNNDGSQAALIVGGMTSHSGLWLVGSAKHPKGRHVTTFYPSGNSLDSIKLQFTVDDKLLLCGTNSFGNQTGLQVFALASGKVKVLDQSNNMDYPVATWK